MSKPATQRPSAPALPTADQITAARVAGRLHEQLAEPFLAGPTPLPPLVPPETIVNERVAASLETFDRIPPPLAAAKSTGALIAKRAAEDAAALNKFVAMAAELFECPSRVSDPVRLRLRGPFIELRNMAQRLNAEAARTAADPTAAR